MALEASAIALRDPSPVKNAYLQSGIGREGSKYGVDDRVEARYLSLGGIEE